MAERDEAKQKQTLIFTYGTLKQGFANHGLMQDLISSNDAAFLGRYATVDPLPLVCGPQSVPFLLNLPGSGSHRVRGELYSVSDAGLVRLDHLEGISLGHYECLPVQLLPDGAEAVGVAAEAYYAHRSFAKMLWLRAGQVGFSEYSEKESAGYVKKELRSKDRSFLEEIRLFVSASSSSSSM
ncbi:putative gamma-glutamylcyclotransferase At3g02910 [Diospyros lotus]|uniref:putative gamma-glutamylcyclotransferase At3g02910 n=1 Tax=Diospyros lotus TaxID=55363 RepID=UPI00225593BB|nr:putative gamma-glutamylcyclotransferase At3g02910 [Diospyros lotus]